MVSEVPKDGLEAENRVVMGLSSGVLPGKMDAQMPILCPFSYCKLQIVALEKMKKDGQTNAPKCEKRTKECGQG